MSTCLVYVLHLSMQSVGTVSETSYCTRLIAPEGDTAVSSRETSVYIYKQNLDTLDTMTRRVLYKEVTGASLSTSRM